MRRGREGERSRLEPGDRPCSLPITHPSREGFGGMGSGPNIGAAHPVSSPAEKRDFSFLRRAHDRTGELSRRGAGRVVCTGAALLAAIIAVLATASPSLAQHPATLLGRVTDAATGAPLEGARIELDGGERATSTDASGAFR